MMRDARAAVEVYGAAGASEALALRVYTTRLLGGDPALVLHGGGNTSVKTQMTDLLGETVDVLCVKGSGWDMATIEPPGLPAVKLDAVAQAAPPRGADRRGHGAGAARHLLDPDGAQSVGRDAAARVPAARLRRPHACRPRCCALTDQPDGGRACAGGVRRAPGLRALHHARASRWPRRAADIFDADPERRGPDPATSTASSPSATTRARPTSG